MHKAVNWNKEVDDYTQMFWKQNIAQFWVDTEIPISKDIKAWKLLTPEEQLVYKKVLGGLTLLDTKQGNLGMPKIAEEVEDLQRKAVLSFMSMMENIHAKSYSTIFTTLITTQEIDEVFEWVEQNPQLQYKAEVVTRYYENISTTRDLYMAMVASVFLESFMFYSGFFYPLYLAGQGKMVSSGEIINLILRDESIHGVYVGMLAQEIYKELSLAEQKQVDAEVLALLHDLMDNELTYTTDVYAPIHLDHEVKSFLYYNANKALMNLGRETIYEEQKVNPIVINGLDTETKVHDFFSVKGNGYQKAIYEDLTDDDFVFDNI
ncbi:class 1b ribonucleoside-diphosphate reductase subunit beta [Bacillus cereus]|uniref:Ribonucleoside-diphosphate reductase subunit beta n=1 Tax=Bacillus thuringiensis TaxID=1428 RepID=A0AB36VG42_BACTU|nr:MULTISPECIES: class 1b ribonucleoside-diphosphate reductase subunit beta [Bacillus cereus group]MDO6628783.1 class 1b ribonucleoside-diphosphate reductase subunit beta [Bacillus thuringiensis]MDO6659297.1 class 1b ribonucleoside-diphosphate reductase subunit beta [Bacillus thuringiensis]MDO6698879.1 class 1b ribonucleoside-diphosphate reductase subunit beta [Bacillus thuringiensis]MEB9469487.1 class 1b ribonucleoside-diphosphate reductase subunit beta [Bacillus cereus]MEC0031071.1 class 1b 